MQNLHLLQMADAKTVELINKNSQDFLKWYLIENLLECNCLKQNILMYDKIFKQEFGI